MKNGVFFLGTKRYFPASNSKLRLNCGKMATPVFTIPFESHIFAEEMPGEFTKRGVPLRTSKMTVGIILRVDAETFPKTTVGIKSARFSSDRSIHDVRGRAKCPRTRASSCTKPKRRCTPSP